MSRFVGWDQRRFAAPAHHSLKNASNERDIGGPALEASLSHPTARVTLRVVLLSPIVRVGRSALHLKLPVRGVVFGFIARFGTGVRAGMLGRISPTVGTRAGSENGIFGVRSALSTRNSIDDLQGGILTARRERRARSSAPNQTHRAKRPASATVASRFENREIQRCVCFRGCRRFRTHSTKRVRAALAEASLGWSVWKIGFCPRQFLFLRTRILTRPPLPQLRCFSKSLRTPAR